MLGNVASFLVSQRESPTSGQGRFGMFLNSCLAELLLIFHYRSHRTHESIQTRKCDLRSSVVHRFTSRMIHCAVVPRVAQDADFEPPYIDARQMPFPPHRVRTAACIFWHFCFHTFGTTRKVGVKQQRFPLTIHLRTKSWKPC